jgi:hypothetical protein
MRTFSIIAALLASIGVSAQNVGIGETAPTAKVEIKATSNSNSPLLVKGAGNESVLEIFPQNIYYNTFLGGVSSGVNSALTISNRYFGTLANPHLRLNSIHANGGGSISRMMFSNEFDINNYHEIQSYTGSDQTNHYLAFLYRNTSGSQNLMSFDENARMGIGTNPFLGKVSIGYNSSTGNPTLNLMESEDDYARLNFSSSPYSAFWSISGRYSSVIANRRMHFQYSNYGDVMSLTAEGNVGVGVSDPVNKLEVAGTVKIDDELNRTATGSANLVPIAYGNIHGTGIVNSGSGNFTVSKVGPGWYSITITGQSYHFQTFTTTVTPAGSAVPVVTNTSSGGGNLYVQTYNMAGTATDSPFSFVVYKQ